MRDNESELEPASLDEAAEALRKSVAVRAEWRDELLRELEALPVPRRLTMGWGLMRPVAIRPVAAIAATVIAMAAGALGALAATSDRRAGAALPAAGETHARTIPVETTRATAGGRTVRFALVAPGAVHVSIVGDFNGWDPRATPMQPVRDGRTWLLDMKLMAGRHVYAFVVDGDLVADPSAPRAVDDDFGVQNSVVLVGAL